jgi:predicted aspartyl protease
MQKRRTLAFTTKSDEYLRELSNEIFVSYGSSTLSEGQRPNPIKAKAVWDTGATNTCISTRIAKSLNLIPISKTRISRVTGEETVNVYLVDIYLPNKVIIPNVPVSEPPSLNSCDILIGMDIINIGDFSITNANAKTWFSFRIPSSKDHIDYVKTANLENKLLEKKIKSSKQGTKRKKSKQKKNN